MKSPRKTDKKNWFAMASNELCREVVNKLENCRVDLQPLLEYETRIRKM